MTLPIVHLTGSPYEQGRQHGQQLRTRIQHNVRVYFSRFEREVGLSRAQVLRRAAQALPPIAAQNADYFHHLQGVSHGSGCDLAELTALNLRYEILYYQFGRIAQAEAAVGDGCTAFAVLPAAAENGHLLLGQNWDWIPDVQGAILHTREADGLQTMAFTEAGIVGGKIGFNSAGLGLTINGMTSTQDDWSRPVKPFHVRCYEILRSARFEDAVAVVTGEDRACSANFLIAQTPDRVVDIEAAPDVVRLLDCDDGCLVHANHFLDPAGLGIAEPPNPRRPFSYARRARLRESLNARRPIRWGDLHQYLQDHTDYPLGICRHENPDEPPEQHYMTVTSVVMDLDVRLMTLTDGPPCRNERQTVSLADV